MKKAVFSGEWMECILCGRGEWSDSEVESNWRAVVMDGEMYYACPDEFPADDASTEEFAEAYRRFLEVCLEQWSDGS